MLCAVDLQGAYQAERSEAWFAIKGGSGCYVFPILQQLQAQHHQALMMGGLIAAPSFICGFGAASYVLFVARHLRSICFWSNVLKRADATISHLPAEVSKNVKSLGLGLSANNLFL